MHSLAVLLFLIALWVLWAALRPKGGRNFGVPPQEERRRSWDYEQRP